MHRWIARELNSGSHWPKVSWIPRSGIRKSSVILMNNVADPDPCRIQIFLIGPDPLDLYANIYYG
jgi:hypothetical protein